MRTIIMEINVFSSLYAGYYENCLFHRHYLILFNLYNQPAYIYVIIPTSGMQNSDYER